MSYQPSAISESTLQADPPWGAGVIWNGDPLEPPVIPAKAGIQSHDSTFLKVCGVDSRFRGNDWASQMTPIPAVAG
jgi:hypothetical protein